MKHLLASESRAAAFYFTVAYWAEIEGYPNFSSHCKQHSLLERCEAQRIADFMSGFLDQEVKVDKEAKLPNISFTSLEEAAQACLQMEVDEINALEKAYGVAFGREEYCVCSFLTELISSQIRNVSEIRCRMKQVTEMGDLAFSELAPTAV